MKAATTSRIPDCFQKTPRRINLTPNETSTSELLTLAVDGKGIHAIMKTGTKIHYCLFNLSTGRQEHDSAFPTDINSFFGISQSNVNLTCANECSESVLILRDGNNAIYPLVKDCADAIRDPQWLDLQPIKCLAAASLTLSSVGANLKSQVAIIAFVPEVQFLMPRILRCDLKGFKNALAQLEADGKSQMESVLAERCDGNRNIFHACVSMCSPTSNKELDPGSTTTNSVGNVGLDCISGGSASRTDNRVSIREMMRRATQNSMDVASSNNPPPASAEDSVFMPVTFWPTNSEYESHSGDEDSMNGQNSQSSASKLVSNAVYVSDPTERRENSAAMLLQMCQSPAFRPYLKQFLSTKDAQGQTPFMLAVTSRAYQAGLILFNVIIEISKGDAVDRDSMIFPPGSAPHQSPLYVLCCNDTCSFTWTGADHINQDIFECKTCGLTGSLCCCTECAKVCHKGHDCKLKRTSPTAYCDCWEKCKCKALIAGNQTKRFDLLRELANDTDLVTKPNSRGEPILLFLIQTVGRQVIEQRQYRSRVRSSTTANRKTPSLDVDNDMPDHDLEPPRFARKALDRLLVDWPAVKAMILTGSDPAKRSQSQSAENKVFYNETHDQNIYLQSQSGTTLLDKFTHSLFVRCNNDPLDTLLSTLTRELQSEDSGRAVEAQIVARRFIRSVSRIFVIFSLERLPSPDKQRRYEALALQQIRSFSLKQTSFQFDTTKAFADLPTSFSNFDENLDRRTHRNRRCSDSASSNGSSTTNSSIFYVVFVKHRCKFCMFECWRTQPFYALTFVYRIRTICSVSNH